jgi:hypothetical protein
MMSLAFMAILQSFRKYKTTKPLRAGVDLAKVVCRTLLSN